MTLAITIQHYFKLKNQLFAKKKKAITISRLQIGSTIFLTINILAYLVLYYVPIKFCFYLNF